MGFLEKCLDIEVQPVRVEYMNNLRTRFLEALEQKSLYLLGQACIAFCHLHSTDTEDFDSMIMALSATISDPGQH